MISITLAQLNLTIGDLAGNVAKMVAAAGKAAADSADLIVFSELSITGYYPGDMLDEEDFLARIDAAFRDLLSTSRQFQNLHWVIGLPIRHDGPGKKLHNGLRVIKNGEVLLEYAKQLLPTYNIFDERRHFDPGPDVAKVLPLRDAQIGFLICEDGWNDDGADYGVNPFSRMRDAAPDLLVSINASPSNIGKREQRHRIFSSASQRNRFPILYVNQAGGHDQIVFDGASFAVEPDSGVVFEAQRFVEDVETLSFRDGKFLNQEGSRPRPVATQGLATPEFYRQQIVLGLRDYARRCGFSKAVVGSSGGIDSALTLALAVEALGPDNVNAITMPSRYSSEGSVDDSEQLCRNLGIPLHHHPIAEIVAGYAKAFENAVSASLQGLALENLQARIRGTILMEYSNSFGHLLLTTGNKSEISVGYCTLYGDTNGGLGLIGDLYKTEVFALSRYLNGSAGKEIIPHAIIEKPPSAELAPDQKDTDSLPPYDVLDEILKLLIEGEGLAGWEFDAASAFVAQLTTQPEGPVLLARIKNMITRSEYKRRQAPPIIRVRSRAFGSGRQMPIAAKFQ